MLCKHGRILSALMKYKSQTNSLDIPSVTLQCDVDGPKKTFLISRKRPFLQVKLHD